jgi:excisionase family DNA binding protein
MDIYYEIKELKQRQESILTKLDALINDSTREKVYDLEELTNLLKISKRLVFKWLKEGILPHTRVGGKIWITEEQLKMFLEKNGSNPTFTK